MTTHENVVSFDRARRERAKEKNAQERALAVAGWKYKALCLKDRTLFKARQVPGVLLKATRQAVLKSARLFLLIACYVGFFYSGFFAFYHFYKGFPDGYLPVAGFVALFIGLRFAKTGIKRGFGYLIAKG